MSEWNRLTWGEVSDLRYGKALRGYKDGDGPTQVFGTNGPIGHTAEEPLATGPRPVVGRKGAYRGVHLAAGPFWVIDTAYWLEPRASLDPVFAYYALLGVDINGMDSGSALPSLTRDHFYGVPLVLPPLEEQERIAGVLGAFDDLIETNRRLASGLEILARAVSSRPRGRVPLVDVADIPRLVQRRPEGLVDHYSIPAYDNGYLASRESSETILSGKQVLVTDSVLISRLNPTTERTWMVYPDEQVSAVCSPEFAVVRGTEALPSEVLWAFASRPDFWDQMRGSVGGTTNSRQRVDKAAIPAFEVPDPSELSAQETAAIRTSVRSATELRREAASLSGQRDELLPLLMSGRVRVRDVEAAVS